MLRLVTSDCFILTSLVPTWITISLYSLHSPVLASTIFRLALTSVALPPGNQCMIAGWFVLSIILRVMESPMTRVFDLSELMVGGFGVLDPVTGGVETREGSTSDSDSLLNEENRLKVTPVEHSYSISLQKPWESCPAAGTVRGDLYYLYLLVAQTLFHPFLHWHELLTRGGRRCF